VEFQYLDFIFCAMDQVTNQAAKLRLMTGGKASVPVVFRGPQGATGRGAQHSQSIEAYVMHTPGIKVVAPSTPYDAKGLIVSAIRDNNPVVFMEHKVLYGAASPGGGKAASDTAMQPIGTEVPEEIYSIPFGVADVKRAGGDVTIIATMLMVHRALVAAEALAAEGIECEVIDPRTLVPFDVEAVVTSLRKTHRALVVSEDVSRAGASAEIMALIHEHAFYELDAPIARVAAANAPTPFAPASERHAIPQVADIVAAVRKVIED
jgi:acetoin:2,6-dichlorophenolindophenol oxidoreductase subunit beta